MLEAFIIILFIILFFGIFAFFVYLPAIIHHIRLEKMKKQLDIAIQNLDFSDSLFVVTEPLGLGGLEYGNVSFADVQKNQTIATNSVLALMRGIKIIND